MSTLDIHGWGAPTPEQDVAIDNVRRFVAAGGTVVYGTDLGNGPLPLGVNRRELRALAAAGLDAEALLHALTGDPPRRSWARRDRAVEGRTPGPEMHVEVHPWGTSASLGAVTYVPGPPPEDLADLDHLDGPDELVELTRWLAGATTLHLADVLHPAFAPPSGTTTREDER
ncbi:hypothetical protein [Cellulosimicrobium sp. CUA-896]|uniref:hypothetical protein n=1 Tax=Cellulosimicrobium sp. CUA-896 TaxID=1517881 RepID=UPI0011153483|nr:hypothetical protein [Cellulosimicrobium sp. CUA-896]